MAETAGLLELTVGAEGAGARLDQFLVQHAPELTRSRLKQLIDEGEVQVNGAEAKPARKLKAGDRVRLLVPAPRPTRAMAEDLAFTVLYEDRELLALDKPAGMVVHPAAGHFSGTLVNALLHRVKDLQGIGGELRPGLVHRLDRETSGCMVVAKSEPALNALQASFKRREVEKRYLAIVHGAPPPSGTWDTAYGRHARDRKRFTSKLGEGKRAVTHWQVLERFDGAALVQVRLETGRTHQVRVHFADHGFPLLHDAVYGGTKREAKLGPGALAQAATAIGRQALHAAELEFPHPSTGERIRVRAELPADYAAALSLLRAGR